MPLAPASVCGVSAAIATVIPHTGSTADRGSGPAGVAARTDAMISARIDTATSSGVRAPIHTPAGVWILARSSCVSSSPATTAAPRFGLATSPTYGTPARTAAVSAGASSRPCEATTTASGSGLPSGVIS